MDSRGVITVNIKGRERIGDEKYENLIIRRIYKNDRIKCSREQCSYQVIKN
jgi:hypothetical protein